MELDFRKTHLDHNPSVQSVLVLWDYKHLLQGGHINVEGYHTWYIKIVGLVPRNVNGNW